LLGGGNSDSLSNYYIGTNSENFGGNYTKLDLAWHTGIRMGAQSQYGGVRIFDSEDFGTVLFSVGTSGTGVVVSNTLTVTGGNIVLGGISGRIQGVVSVLSGTDATSKTYVDGAISTAGNAFLPKANPTFTGTLTGSAATITTVTGALSGNATTATTLQTARTIAGVSFNGSANISLNNNAITNGAGYITSYVNTNNYVTGGNVTSGTVTLNRTGLSNVSFTINNSQITNGMGFTTNTGTVTSVATGAGLTGGTITGSGTVSVDYTGSDSIVMAAPTGNVPDADDMFLYGADSSGGGESVSGQFTDLPLSIMNNDSGFTSNTGTVTSVATGSGLSGGTITGSGTLSVDSTVIRTTGGQTRQGNNTFAATSTSTSYGLAGIELRESNLSGSSGTPPFLGFHWGGVVASSIAIESNGTIAIRNNPGTGYEQFACGNLKAYGGIFTLGTSGVGDMYLGNYSTGNYFRFHTNNSNTYFDMNCGDIYWRQGSSTRFYFYPSTANMTVNGTITQNSDIRIKENIVEIGDCISKVQAMRGVYYNRTDFNTEVTKVGVIAQEVEAVLPELILESPENGFKSVAYAELTAVLINAIKEQQEIIENLTTRIEQLEN